jgi:predicted secreted protein
MTTSAFKGYKTLLKIGDGASNEAFTTIAELLRVDGPDESATTVDVTNADSPNNAREFIGEALVDGGEINASCNFVVNSATQEQVRTDMYAGTTRNFKVVLANSSANEITFSAIVTGFNPNGGGEGSQMQAALRLKVTGKPTHP